MKDGVYDLELRIAKLLRTGVVLAGLMLALGWILMLVHDEPSQRDLSHFAPVPLMSALPLAYLSRDWGRLVANAGLVVLVTLPLVRVLLTALLFWKNRERKLAWIALLVFSALVGSFLLGIEI